MYVHSTTNIVFVPHVHTTNMVLQPGVVTPSYGGFQVYNGHRNLSLCDPLLWVEPLAMFPGGGIILGS